MCWEVIFTTNAYPYSKDWQVLCYYYTTTAGPRLVQAGLCFEFSEPKIFVFQIKSEIIEYFSSNLRKFV